MAADGKPSVQLRLAPDETSERVIFSERPGRPIPLGHPIRITGNVKGVRPQRAGGADRRNVLWVSFPLYLQSVVDVIQVWFVRISALRSGFRI